jgi:O-Antigen ligase
MSEFKYIIFFAVLFIGVPFNYILARKFVHYEKFLWFLLIFFTANMVDINFISMETYRGSSKGFEIGMVDIVVFSMLAVVIGRRDEHPLKIPPGTTLYFLYFFFSLISIINSDVLVYSFFEIWKMTRMYIFFFVVFNMIRKFEEFGDIMIIISLITLYITVIVLKQKYLLGIFQAYGPFPHQNSLVMYMIVFGSLLLAYLLNNDKIKLFYWLMIFGAAGIDIIATLSRGGMALFAFSTSIIFLFSYTNHMSFRKLGITLLFIVLASGVLYKASDTILERVKSAPTESIDVRVALAKAAQNMANDKFFGIGLNNFGLKINPPYQYSNHIERKDADEKGGLVETIYLMIAAETGWHNLVVFVVFLLYFYVKNIRNYFRMKGSIYRYIPLALIAALSSVYVQSTLEWVLKQTNNFYQLMLIFAIIGVVSRLLDKEDEEKDIS